MLRLVSRSCQVNRPVTVDATKKSETSARKVILTSQKSKVPKDVSSRAKKLTSSRSNIHGKKADVIKSAIKGRFVVKFHAHLAKMYVVYLS